MTLKIDTFDSIIINGQDTGLKLTQRRDGTVVYTPERRGLGTINRVVKEPSGRDARGVMRWGERVVQVNDAGAQYKEHKMPYNRYSSAHDAPKKPGQAYDPNVTAGRAQLEADVLALLMCTRENT